MYDKILVPVDASPTAEAGLREAVRLARLCGSRLRLLHVVTQAPDVTETILCQDGSQYRVCQATEHGAALLGRLRDEAARHVAAIDTVLIEAMGQPLHAVVEQQVAGWGAELVVLGTHGRRGVERLLAGSVAEQVVRHATVPVLLVRSAAEDEAGNGGLQSIAAAIA